MNPWLRLAGFYSETAFFSCSSVNLQADFCGVTVSASAPVAACRLQGCSRNGGCLPDRPGPGRAQGFQKCDGEFIATTHHAPLFVTLRAGADVSLQRAASAAQAGREGGCFEAGRRETSPATAAKQAAVRTKQ